MCRLCRRTQRKSPDSMILVRLPDCSFARQLQGSANGESLDLTCNAKWQAETNDWVKLAIDGPTLRLKNLQQNPQYL